MSEHDMPFGFEENVKNPQPALNSEAVERCKNRTVEWQPLREYQLVLTNGQHFGFGFLQTVAAACHQPSDKHRLIHERLQTTGDAALFANSLEVCEFKAEQIAQIWLANNTNYTSESFVANHVRIVPA